MGINEEIELAAVTWRSARKSSLPDWFVAIKNSYKVVFHFTVERKLDVSFLCVCPLIDDKLRDNIVKVAVPQ